MKRILAIAVSSLALGASAQGLPQPSFMDYVALEPADHASSGGSAPQLSRGDFPSPSFMDYVAIEPEATRTSGGIMLSRRDLPQPSFQDYPAETRESGTATASASDLRARRE